MDINISWKLSEKQRLALELLEDSTTEEVVYGGAAGGGKTVLGVGWVTKKCLQYPSTRWFFGRNELKKLKQTTLKSFFWLSKQWGIENLYRVDFQAGEIKFINGSEIVLLDLQYFPSDDDYQRFGSFEFTGGFIDEAGEVEEKCVSMLRTRFRYKLTEYGLTMKLLMTCNPSHNFIYRDFYKPKRLGTLPKHKAFLPSLPKDNPFLSDKYLDSLTRITDKTTKERLLFGNWEYDDDPSCIFEYDDIVDLFTNPPQTNGEKYLSVDVSRRGGDNMVVMLWDGLEVKRIVSLPKEIKYNLKSSSQWIIDFCNQEGIKRSHVVIDEDGVGGGVVDNIEGVKGFMNGSRPFEQRDEKLNYANLKTQCYFHLSRLCKEGKIRINCESSDIKEKIIEELQQVKQKDVDKDGRISLVGKDIIKEHLGRSPDFADTLMMRMYFEVVKEPEPNIIIW